MQCLKNRLILLFIATTFFLFVGCSSDNKTNQKNDNPDVQSITESAETINETGNCTSETKQSVNAEDIVSVAVDVRYGEKDTDAKCILIEKADGKYVKIITDYGQMTKSENEITEKVFIDVAKEASKLTTVRTYNTPPALIWSYVTIKISSGEYYFFNDQKEVEKLYQFLMQYE